MNEIDVEGEWLVSRQVLWKVPQQLLEKSPNPEAPPRSKRSWSLTDSSEQQRGEVREGGEEKGGGGGRGHEGGWGGRECGEGGRERGNLPQRVTGVDVLL